MVPKRKAAQITKSYNDSNTSCLIIGIDFGTTFSGVAWARSSKPEHVNLVANWPGDAQFKPSEKNQVPTCISYGSEDKPVAWGYECISSKDALKWFKLLLLDAKDLPAHLGGSRFLAQVMKDAKKDPVEVISDFLRLLWDHSLDQITKEAGKSLVEMSLFRLVVTLPAVWPVYAQLRMKEAVRRAGILDERAAGDTTLNFVSEPEAAALATLDDMSGRADFKENDNFVICDAGGGTVDLISYHLTKSDPMKVKESVKGDGGLCGAIVLDQGFLETLLKIIPEGTSNALRSKAISRILQVDWENAIKSCFSNEGQVFKVPLPYNIASTTPLEGEAVITGKTLDRIYKPVAQSVQDLVQKQVAQIHQKHKKKPKFIILVGGFGKSPYLHKHLEAAFNTTEIIQASGDKPWTAVMRGAVMRGLSHGDPSGSLRVACVDSRFARASFGTMLNILPWEAAVHDPRDRAWCPFQQEFLAVDQAAWFLRCGESVSESPIAMSFWQDFEVEPESIQTELIYSEAPQAPKRVDDSVKPLCTITWFRVPEFKKLPSWTNREGKVLRQVCYEVRMISDGDSLDFAIYYKNKRVAAQNVAVDFRKAARLRDPESDSEY